jgi:putative ABC transport system permease protein
MKLATHIEEGIYNLLSSKLRSLLALLGILVGTASIVAMVLGGELATNEALKQFKTLGTDLLSVTVKDLQDQDQHVETNKTLSLDQANKLIKADKNILLLSPYTQVLIPIQFEGQQINGSIVGVTEEFKKILHINLKNGRFISNLDKLGMYCVIGQTIYEQIKKNMLVDPIGKQIQIGKNFFTIIGIATQWPENNFINTNINESLMIPIGTSSIVSKFSSIDNIIVALNPKADIDKVKNNIGNYLRMYLDKNELFFRSAKELITHMEKQSEILTVFLGLIGSVSLIVGGIGVMNIMLVSIVERQREIGIRRAVGATQSDIRSLFLIEAMMLSLFGGLLGAIIGILIAYVIAYFWKWQFMLLLFPPIIGFTVSATTGIFFGFYPAYKASKLDPIEALRSV